MNMTGLWPNGFVLNPDWWQCRKDTGLTVLLFPFDLEPAFVGITGLKTSQNHRFKNQPYP
jgi:hypothetical protein